VHEPQFIGVSINSLNSLITASLPGAASSVPVQPSAAIFQASGPRFTKNSETIAWLPAAELGKIGDQVEQAGPAAERAGASAQQSAKREKSEEKI